MINPRDILTREYLEEHYVNQGKGMTTIAREIGLKSRTSVKQALLRHGIPIDHDCQRNRRGKPATNIRKGCGEISGSYWIMKQHSARGRNLDFTISIDEAWLLFLQQKRKCALSGVELKFSKLWIFPHRREQTASLDRIDSRQGYIYNNVQWIHKDLNTMKMDNSQEEFIEWCRKVVQYHDNNLSA